jgi:hypothetical protein
MVGKDQSASVSPFHPNKKGYLMGFFAGELEAVLREHNPISQESSWNILHRLNLHPQQIERLQHAAADIGQVATLPSRSLVQIKQELNLGSVPWARLEAGIEADACMRLMMYHNYSLEEAVAIANAIFAQTFKDRLVLRETSEFIYPAGDQSDTPAPHPAPMRRRGRPRKTDKERPLSQTSEEADGATPAELPNSVGIITHLEFEEHEARET